MVPGIRGEGEDRDGGGGGRAESRSCVNSKVQLGSRRLEVGLLLQVVLTTVVSVDTVSVTRLPHNG